jgi:anti-sigma B factor antagonist
VPTSRFLTAATPAAPVLSDRAPGAGESLQLTATVVSHDGAVLVTVSRHLEYSPAADDELVVVTVAGDLDQDTAPLVEIALATALEQNRRVCLDLREVAFFGAAGANSVVAAHVHAVRTGGWFTLRNVHGIVRRVLEITGVDALVATAA